MVWFNLNYFSTELSVDPVKLAAIVGVSMCSAMTFAALSGTLLPIALHKFKIDPALASGPFVTTGNDLSASMIYFLNDEYNMNLPEGDYETVAGMIIDKLAKIPTTKSTFVIGDWKILVLQATNKKIIKLKFIKNT
jgi:hypothetical protein